MVMAWWSGCKVLARPNTLLLLATLLLAFYLHQQVASCHGSLIMSNFHSLGMLELRWLQHTWRLSRLDKLLLKLLPDFDQKG